MHFKQWLLSNDDPALEPLRSFARGSDWAAGSTDKASALADLETLAPANLDELCAMLEGAWSRYEAARAQGLPVVPAPSAVSNPQQGGESSNLATAIGWIGANLGLLTIGVLSALLLSAIFYSIIFDQNFIRLLAQTEVARGLITFFFAVGTIGVAIVIAFSVLTGDIRHVKERFGLAKDVLTILIGVLGTIIGYYFGTTDDGATEEALQIAQPLVVPAQIAAGTNFQILSSIHGGAPPYSYSIRFEKDAIAGIEQTTADDGLLLNLPFSLPPGFNEASLPFELVIRDSGGTERSFARQLSILKDDNVAAATTVAPGQ